MSDSAREHIMIEVDVGYVETVCAWTAVASCRGTKVNVFGAGPSQVLALALRALADVCEPQRRR